VLEADEKPVSGLLNSGAIGVEDVDLSVVGVTDSNEKSVVGGVIDCDISVDGVIDGAAGPD
jgi:hypothetical protein